jgi:hypothetical protein
MPSATYGVWKYNVFTPFLGAEGDSLILLRLKDLLYGMIGTFTIKKLDVPI